MTYYGEGSLIRRAQILRAEVDELSRAMEKLVHLHTQRPTYAAGYEHGESSQLADWEFALMDLLPDDVEIRPSTVAAYISRLSDPLVRGG